MSNIDVFDSSVQILKALKKGILLNTSGEKFNSMVIGWGHLGIIWGKPTFTVYVRQSRYTKPQLDRTGEFGISLPLSGAALTPEIFRACGVESGRDIDKGRLFTLLPGRSIAVPALKEVPLTLECRVLYQQDQSLEALPKDITEACYSHGADAGDFHTAYIGEIVDAYIAE